MIVDYLSSLAGWLIWGWIAFMGAAMVVSLIGSGFKATTTTSTFALCGYSAYCYFKSPAFK
jgi:hypothetical protein